MSVCYKIIKNVSRSRVILYRKIVINSFGITTKKNLQSCALAQNYRYNAFDPYLSIVRWFAKGSTKGKKGRTIAIDERELSEVFEVEKLYSDFRKPIDNMKNLYLQQLGLRSSEVTLQNLKVKFKGDTYTLQDLAEIWKKTPKEIHLNMEVFTEAIPDVMESLRKSALNVNPNQQGHTIIIPVPKVTREHRETLAKNAKALFNNCKVRIRDVQNKHIKVVTAKEKISEDTIQRLKTQLTLLGDNHVSEAEAIYKAKVEELLPAE